MNTYKLGSLFDGSGGFPLAGALCGIEPVWASEVEPYPIAVTRSRFPMMKHLGDISKINGAEIEPVDIITFGSPCQDLSVAGKQAGLKHKDNGDEETTRSGLFMEAVRIIKEMRTATNGRYPTFALWENVPGAFSSNKGEDFRLVCEELIKIVEPSAFMPSVPKNGWPYADSYVGDGWSLAYRVFDAQYWGVPQRRRRIHLVADFRGERAREILFEREGVRGYFAEGGTPWQGAPADAERGTGTNDREGEGFDGHNGSLTGDVSSTLGVNCGVSTGRNGVIERRDRGLDDVIAVDQQGGKGGANFAINIMPTLCSDSHGTPHAVAYTVDQGAGKSSCSVQEEKAPTLACTHGGAPAVVYTALTFEPGAARRLGGYVWKDIAGTLRAEAGDNRLACCYVLDDQGGQSINVHTDGKAPTLRAETHGNLPCVMSFHITQDTITGEKVTPCLSAGNPKHGQASLGVVHEKPVCAKCSDGEAFLANGDTKTGTLCAEVAKRGFHGTQEILSGAYHVIEKKHPPRYIVRRLTPTECARLQGFADWWGDIERIDIFNEREYKFWLDVRNTHARINGKKEQDYTEKQMLTWYNKLWTDSAEYKMWGNGIALPPALYCMQGVADALNAEEDDAWMQ